MLNQGYIIIATRNYINLTLSCWINEETPPISNFKPTDYLIQVDTNSYINVKQCSLDQ